MEKDEILDLQELKKFLKSGDKEAMKASLIAQKKMKSVTKDCITPYKSLLFDKKDTAIKANVDLTVIPDLYKVRVMINTTNLMDNSYDVHYPGMWDKSLKENKMIMHLQEHMRGFQYIISDGEDLKAYTQTFTWKELGYSFKGKTEGLVFDSVIKRAMQKPRCEFMYEQYGRGYVKNHSVGMQYVKMVLCVNEPEDEYYGAEFEAWEKYFPEVANQDYALEKGFFWLIKEAKVIEGSAVPLGSNWITPTLDNNLKGEPGNHSTNEPGNHSSKAIDFDYLKQNFKLSN